MKVVDLEDDDAVVCPGLQTSFLVCYLITASYGNQ